MRAVLPAPLSVVDKISEYRIPKDLMEPRRSMYMKKQAEIQKGLFTTYTTHIQQSLTNSIDGYNNNPATP